jgi:potassium efflux system protein
MEFCLSMQLAIDTWPSCRHRRIPSWPLVLGLFAWIATTGSLVTAQTPTAPAPSTAQWQSLSSETNEPANPQIAVVGFNSDAPAEAESPPATELSKELIQQELSAVESSTELATEVAAEIKERLRKAATWLEAEAAAKKRQLELEAILPQTPDKLTQVRGALANFAEAEFNTLPAGNTIVELEAQLASLRQQLESEEKSYREREAEVEGRTTRLTTLAKEVVETEEKIAKLKTQAEALKPSDIAAKSQSIELRARLRLREQELITSKLERRRLEEIAELLPLQRDLAKRIWSNRQKMLARWQTAIDTWRKEESKRQAETARRMVENAHPALKSLAEENALIAETRLKTAAEIQRLTASIKQLTEQSKQIGEDFKDLNDRVEHAGATSTTGLLLRKKRSELPSVADFVSRATFVQQTMPAAHLQLMEWKRQRAEVEDPEDASKMMAQSLDASLAGADPEQVSKVLIRLLTDRRALLEKAIPDQNTLLEDLNQLELANQTLREQVAEFRRYLNQRVLWIRSTDLISLGELREARNGLKMILQPARWQETMRVGGLAMLRRPAVGLAVLAMFALLLAFRARLHAWQKVLLQSPTPGTATAYRNYFGAFLIALVLSTRWPTLLLLIGYRLRLAAESFTWTENVGDALVTSVVFLWVCELIRELCRRDSVGERAFGWPAKATAAVRGTLELLTMAGIPLLALLQLTQFGEVDQMQGLQRVLFIGLLTLLGVQLAWLTRPRGTLMTCLIESSPKSMVARFRHAICAVVTCAPLALVILSMIGYHFSAYQLSRHLAETGAVLVATIVLYSLALCWISVVSYNRALQDPGEEAATDQISHLTPEGETTVAGSVVNQQVAISTTEFYSKVGDEVRDLLRYACWILLLVSGWFIWSEVLPALRVFDHVVMWQSIEPVAESFVDADGNDSFRIVDQNVPTTLTDVLVALLVCLVTLMVGRRLPGVLELVLLEHLPIESGGRQAIAILARYFATAVGLLIACSIIRLSWSSVQWLAAAMTVGLGFGLQEIFANLVSGLIILFERPIRVGDTVSVGDVTGTVSRMQMRATTVTDYDRRELIVPNKKFITDNVINWTLSDPISRVVLPVGVAYGTDAGQVREILLRIAKQCPFVLAEPAPNTLFKGFGDSTLNMQLMVFIPQRSVYLDVVNNLNNAIAREFAQADIEIAFPQLDLHVKNAAAVVPQATNDATRSAAA